MNEPTHKIINGVRVECTPDEINEIKAAWEKEDVKRNLRKIEKEKKILLKENVKNKLIALGLSEEEIKLINLK